ncbi:uncharacterized protein Aud_010326 [Aspergillus udagawae]|uniref:Uncharacterized protein n=1 Tax=Aspergillus udagawae TaxID=91492 RepID=A0A8E0V3P4_9EURO|nr:uncharacterized protein Aud_010326 [Aspergillus udagawae]GIC93838.1 hypothetical protein Aud_010326 [Aspergillus udagawae]
MEDLSWEEDEFLNFWVTYNAGIEHLPLASLDDKSENAQSPARSDAGAGNENNQDLNTRGLGIELHEDVTEMENKGCHIPAGLNPATENANVQIPVETDTVSEHRGGVPVESSAPEGPMTREEIILKWLSGLRHDPDPLSTVDDRSPQELDSRARDRVEQEWGQGWARTRRATGVPRQIPNYRFFDYTSGTYTNMHGAPPPE